MELWTKVPHILSTAKLLAIHPHLQTVDEWRYVAPAATGNGQNLDSNSTT